MGEFANSTGTACFANCAAAGELTNSAGNACLAACPIGEVANSADTACLTDNDADGTPDTLDVDDDNDGLIEIASAAELNNMRHNLAGTSYKTSSGGTDNRDWRANNGDHRLHYRNEQRLFVRL